MVGVPGSGKSTRAKHIADALIAKNNKSIIVSADQFFVKDGVYKFDGTKIRGAHQDCQERFRQALKENIDVVIVDNTNTRHKERQFYVELAKQHKYAVYLELVGNTDDESLETYAARCLHSVPIETIRKYAQRISNDALLQSTVDVSADRVHPKSK